jgi:hypothetical protein
MVLGSNLCLFRGQWWCSAWSWVRIFVFFGVNGGVVHGRGFESLTFGARRSSLSCKTKTIKTFKIFNLSMIGSFIQLRRNENSICYIIQLSILRVNSGRFHGLIACLLLVLARVPSLPRSWTRYCMCCGTLQPRHARPRDDSCFLFKPGREKPLVNYG